MRRRRINWRLLDRKGKSAHLRRVLRLKRNKNATGKEIRDRYFRGVTPMGLITHCWRHGPKLPHAWSPGPIKRLVNHVRRYHPH